MNYNFPFPPYQIQIDFMNALQETLANKKVGLFESPTGTGKSLSLICGSLTFILEHYRANRLLPKEEIGIPLLQEKIKKRKFGKKTAVVTTAKLPVEESDLIENEENESVFSSNVMNMLLELENAEDGEKDELDCFKLFYCSRTHSQINQFIREIKKTRFSECIKEKEGAFKTKVVALSSRTNLCINAELKKKARNNEMLNSLCGELNRTTEKCSYMQSLDALKLHAMDSIHDVEDLYNLGKELDICPFYASKKAIPSSQIVTMPYQLLINKASREAMNLRLKDQIIIIDEAHNLIETIMSIYSAKLSVKHIQLVSKLVLAYIKEYKTRFSGKTLLYLKQLHLLSCCICSFVNDNDPGAYSLNDLIFNEKYQIDTINPLNLVDFIATSRMTTKLYIFNQRKQLGESVVCFNAFASFIGCLSNQNDSGRLFIYNDDEKVKCLKYLLLNPAAEFKDVVEQARCIILAGGTMEPFADYRNLLFPQLSENDIGIFQCGHVTDDSNLLPISLTGNDYSFDFKFGNRENKEMLTDLGNVICSLSAVIPDGIVIFVPSYAYLSFVLAHFKSTQILTRLQKRKDIYTEPQKSDECDRVLQEYAASISSSKGAILFSVVGGKMSEGINFSDHLGRGVIVVGLPYPNVHSPELQAKIKYLDESGKNGKEYVENMCMRAVNQSIGRAIRHKNDYAVVVLIDQRYGSGRVREKLPLWIRKLVRVEGKIGGVVGSVARFFRERKERQDP